MQQAGTDAYYLKLTTPLPVNSVVGPAWVDDPYERGRKVVATRNLRDDPLGRLFARGHIDKARHDAGRDYQACYEAMQIVPVKGLDFTKEPVDGGGAVPDPFTDRQRRAGREVHRLETAVRAKWGTDGVALVRDVLLERKFLAQVLEARGRPIDERALRGFGWLLGECLEAMAIARGYARPAAAPE